MVINPDAPATASPAVSAIRSFEGPSHLSSDTLRRFAGQGKESLFGKHVPTTCHRPEPMGAELLSKRQKQSLHEASAILIQECMDKIPSPVYPRVKARSEEEEVSVAVQKDTSALLLRVLDSLSLEDRRSPGNEHEDDSPPQARIPKSYVPITPMPSIAVSKGPSSHHKAKNVKEIDLDNRTNIRASPIPPRAVLSSPDNDGMIGNRNKLLRERQSVLKTRNSGPGTVTQGKTILKKDSPTTTTRRIPKECDGKTQLNEKLAKEPRVPQQKPVLKKGKLTAEGTQQAFHFST